MNIKTKHCLIICAWFVVYLSLLCGCADDTTVENDDDFQNSEELNYGEINYFSLKENSKYIFEKTYDGNLEYSIVLDKDGTPCFSKYYKKNKKNMFKLVKNKKTLLSFEVKNPFKGNTEIRYKSLQPECFYYSMKNNKGSKAALISYNLKTKKSKNIKVDNFAFLGYNGNAYTISKDGISVYNKNLKNVNTFSDITADSNTELFAIRGNYIFYSTNNHMYVYDTDANKELMICDCEDLVLQVMNIEVGEKGIIFIALNGEQKDKSSLYIVDEESNKPKLLIDDLDNVYSFCVGNAGVYYSIWDTDGALYKIDNDESKKVYDSIGSKIILSCNKGILYQDKGSNEGNVFLFNEKTQKVSKVHSY